MEWDDEEQMLRAIAMSLDEGGGSSKPATQQTKPKAETSTVVSVYSLKWHKIK